MPLTPINPDALDPPKGFAHGMLASSCGRMLFVAGQTAANAAGQVTEPSFVAQFETALTRALTVVGAAGGQAEHVVRMTVYVTDIAAYRRARAALGGVWLRHMGRHYPAMTLVEVTRLVDEGALVEIEVTAIVPEP